MTQRNRVAGVALGLLLATLLGACRSQPVSSVPVEPGDERAVWEALLRQAYVGENTKVVVLDPDLENGRGDWFGRRPRGVPADAWTAFLRAFRRGGSLPRDLDAGVALVWVDDDVGAPEGEGVETGWDAFHERYPGNSGLVSLSRVGFSRDGRTAVVYGFVGQYDLMASGDVFVLRRTGGGWRLVETRNVLIA